MPSLRGSSYLSVNFNHSLLESSTGQLTNFGKTHIGNRARTRAGQIFAERMGLVCHREYIELRDQMVTFCSLMRIFDASSSKLLQFGKRGYCCFKYTKESEHLVHRLEEARTDSIEVGRSIAVLFVPVEECAVNR